MLDTINARLSEVRQRRDDCQAHRSRLPLLREELTREAYRLQSLEAALDEVQMRVDKLQSASLAGMMASLMGRKESQLAEHEAQLAELQHEFEACEKLVVELDEQVRGIEAHMGDAEELEAAFQAALREKEQFIVEQGGPDADRLGELIEQVSCAKGYELGLQKAVQVGRHLTERLHSMTRAVGRSKTKGIAAAAGGALISATVNTVMQGRSAKPAVGRVIEGLEEFYEAINNVQWNSDEPRDERVLQLASGIAGFATDVKSRGAMGMVWDKGTVGPMLDAIQELIGHLKDVAAETAGQVKSLQTERQQIIEQA